MYFITKNQNNVKKVSALFRLLYSFDYTPIKYKITEIHKQQFLFVMYFITKNQNNVKKVSALFRKV